MDRDMITFDDGGKGDWEDLEQRACLLCSCHRVIQKGNDKKQTRESGREQNKLVKRTRHCRVKEVREQLKLTVTVLLSVEGGGRMGWAVQVVRWPARNETAASDSADGFLKLIQSSHRWISRLQRPRTRTGTQIPGPSPLPLPHTSLPETKLVK